MRPKIAVALAVALLVLVTPGSSQAAKPCVKCNHPGQGDNDPDTLKPIHCDRRVWKIFVPSLGGRERGRYDNCLVKTKNDSVSYRHSKADTIWMSAATNDSIQFATRKNQEYRVFFGTGSLKDWPFEGTPPDGGIRVPPRDCSDVYRMKAGWTTETKKTRGFRFDTVPSGPEPENRNSRKNPFESRQVAPVVGADG